MSFAEFAKAFNTPTEAWTAWTNLPTTGPPSGQPNTTSTGYDGSFGPASHDAGGDFAYGSNADANPQSTFQPGFAGGRGVRGRGGFSHDLPTTNRGRGVFVGGRGGRGASAPAQMRGGYQSSFQTHGGQPEHSVRGRKAIPAVDQKGQLVEWTDPATGETKESPVSFTLHCTGARGKLGWLLSRMYNNTDAVLRGVRTKQEAFFLVQTCAELFPGYPVNSDPASAGTREFPGNESIAMSIYNLVTGTGLLSTSDLTVDDWVGFLVSHNCEFDNQPLAELALKSGIQAAKSQKQTLVGKETIAAARAAISGAKSAPPALPTKGKAKSSVVITEVTDEDEADLHGRMGKEWRVKAAAFAKSIIASPRGVSVATQSPFSKSKKFLPPKVAKVMSADKLDLVIFDYVAKFTEPVDFKAILPAGFKLPRSVDTDDKAQLLAALNRGYREFVHRTVRGAAPPALPVEDDDDDDEVEDDDDDGVTTVPPHAAPPFSSRYQFNTIRNPPISLDLTTDEAVAPKILNWADLLEDEVPVVKAKKKKLAAAKAMPTRRGSLGSATSSSPVVKKEVVAAPPSAPAHLSGKRSAADTPADDAAPLPKRTASTRGKRGALTPEQ